MTDILTKQANIADRIKQVMVDHKDGWQVSRASMQYHDGKHCFVVYDEVGDVDFIVHVEAVKI